MIGRIHENPDDTDGPVLYVALAFINGTWQPIRPLHGNPSLLGGQVEAIDAAKVCALHTRNAYRAISDQTRVLRALCEHREFDFEGEVIDAPLIRAKVVQLEADIATHWPDFDRMLDQPGVNDRVQISGAPMAPDDNGVLVPDSSAHEPDPQPGPRLPAWSKDPGATLASFVRSYVENLEQLTGAPVPVQELNKVITALEALRDERAAEAEPCP